MGVEIVVDHSISSLGVFSYYGFAEEIIVEKGRVDLREYVKGIINNLLNTYTLDRIKDNPTIRSYREMMWRLGIDPTKVRVSSEAILRRVIRNGSFPYINSVVDSCNLASLETLVPISVFDLDKVSPPLMLRHSRSGEEFVDVDDNIRMLRGVEVVLADSRAVLHIYPHRDSILSSVDLNTRNVLVVAYGAPGIPNSLVRGAVERVFKYLSMFCYARRLSEVFKIS